MLVIVDHLSPGTDPIDYLLWQIANHLLAGKGTVSECSRWWPPLPGDWWPKPSAVWLRPSRPSWYRFKGGGGRAAGVRQPRLGSTASAAVARLAEVAGGPAPMPDDLHRACRGRRGVGRHGHSTGRRPLDRTEPRNATGWFRKGLYRGLVRLALLADRGPFEDFHNGEDTPPEYVHTGGNPSRCLLDAWLELLATLTIPVVVVFDQLETYLRAPTPEQERVNQRSFSQAVTSFIDKVPNVCVLNFAEEGIWAELTNAADGYIRGRLTQPFSLPGQPSRTYLEMPRGVVADALARLVRSRLRAGFPELDLTGLPATFPFAPADLTELDGDTIRECLRKLAQRYDAIVYPPPVGPSAEADDRLRVGCRPPGANTGRRPSSSPLPFRLPPRSFPSCKQPSTPGYRHLPGKGCSVP